MSGTKVNKNLEINLRRSEGSGALDANSNLFEDEMNVVIAWVNKHREVMAAQRADNKRHQHDAILISGPRGSGKTTFMYTLRDRIGKHSEMGHSVALLEPLDPSLIDGDDIFLATIIATIYRHLKVNNKTENSKVQETLKQLGAAMIALDKRASRKKLHEVANTPSLFGERLLHSALSSLDVAERFKQFTQAAAAALNVKFFALFLDDVDTAFKQGAQVLETVRRYCVDGVVLPIISGNLDLFRLVLRERVWQDLESLNRSETSEKMKEKIIAQVTELEGQYLLKVLRPERRMKLPAPRERLGAFEQVTLTHADKDSHARLRWLLYRLNQEVFNAPSPEKTTTTLPYPASALFTDNTRQIRSVLAWIGDVLAADFVSQTDLISQNSIPTITKPIENLDVAKILDLHPRIRETQLTEDILAAIAEGNFQPLSLWICSHLNRYATLFRLDPAELGEREDDEPWRIATLAVHAALVRRWRAHPEDQLVYLGSVLAPAVALSNLNTKNTKAIESAEGALVIPSSWQLGQKAPAWHTVARVTASRNTDYTKSRDAYFLKLRKRAPKNSGEDGKVWDQPRERSKQANSDAYRWVRLFPPSEGKLDSSQKSGSAASIQKSHTLFPTVSVWKRMVGDRAERILDWYTICLRYYNSTMDVIDPWSGIIATSELLRLQTLNRDMPNEFSSKIRQLVNELGQNILFNMPAFSSGVGSTDESDDDNDSLQNANDTTPQAENTELNDLWSELGQWIQYYESLHAGQSLTPPVLSVLAERFTQNQISIFNEYLSLDWTVGYMLQSWSLAWLNSCLLADARHADLTGLSEKNLVSVRIPSEAIVGISTNSESPSDALAVSIAHKKSQVQLLRNLGTTLNHLIEQGQSSKTATPAKLFLTFATCPLIYGVLSDDWAKIIRWYCVQISTAYGSSDVKLAWISPEKNRSEFVLPNSPPRMESVHDLLCALVSPPSAPAAGNAKSPKA